MTWAPLGVVLIAVVVQVTHTGLDILLIALALLLLLALERTVGDWLGELVGGSISAILFAALIGGFLWYYFEYSSGSEQAERFFAAADRYGYRAAYFHGPSANSASLARPIGTSGGSAGGGSGGVAPRPGVPVVDGGAAVSSGKAAKPPEARASRAEPSPPASETARSSASEEISTSITVSAVPARLPAAHRTMLRAVVTAGGRPIANGVVEFTVNGLDAGTVRLAPNGTAETTYTTHTPGSYEVRARYPGTGKLTPSVSDVFTLTVLPR